MKRFVLYLILSIVLTVTAIPGSASPTAEASDPLSFLGQPMPDFTVTTKEGEALTFSEVLAEKKAVLVNLWATWCGPCAMEFPSLEEAYEAYRDEVEIIALSVDPNDTDDMLRDYAAYFGMTFKVANGAGTDIPRIFVDRGIPTSVLVDRFGNVVLIEVGAQLTADPFIAAFAALTGDGYTETAVLDGWPRLSPEWTIRFADQNGDPVPGCVVNFCTDEACTPVISDGNGLALFSGEPYPYHLQVIKVPEGYSFDTSQEFYADTAGGEMTFTVTKEN